VTFDEDAELVVLDVSCLKVFLEREEKHQQELVVLVETTARVTKHLKSQVLNHVVEALCRKRRLFRSAQQNITNYRVRQKSSPLQFLLFSQQPFGILM